MNLIEQETQPVFESYQKTALFSLACKRCGNAWKSRNKDGPQRCSKCHSLLWNVEFDAPVEVKQAVAYLRVSSADQLKGDGMTRQRLAIEAHAARTGIEIVDWFEDDITGEAAWVDRPAWMRMLKRLNGVRAIMIEKLDRLARNLIVSEHIVQDLKGRGVTLISTCEDDLNSDDPTKILIRQIISSISAYEKSLIVLKLKAARQRIRESGVRCDGRKPYGGHPDKPEEKEVWARIMAMRAGLMTTHAIAEKLNADGVPTRYEGARWHSAGVARIVKRG